MAVEKHVQGTLSRLRRILSAARAGRLGRPACPPTRQEPARPPAFPPARPNGARARASPAAGAHVLRGPLHGPRPAGFVCCLRGPASPAAAPRRRPRRCRPRRRPCSRPRLCGRRVRRRGSGRGVGSRLGAGPGGRGPSKPFDSRQETVRAARVILSARGPAIR